MIEQKLWDLNPRHGVVELRISTCLYLLPPRNGLDLYTQVPHEHNSPAFRDGRDSPEPDSSCDSRLQGLQLGLGEEPQRRQLEVKL